IKIEDGVEQVATQIKSRKEFKNKMADRVMKISKNLMNEQESDPFGEETEEKKGKRKRHLMKDLSAEKGWLTWKEAQKLLEEYAHYGLSMIREVRHVAFPYHLITSIPKSIEFIANAQVGKFRRQVKGIVMAVGEISEVKAVRIVDDQNVFHADATVQQIVFRPQKDVAYECVVTMISSRLITSSLFGQITVTTLLDAAAQAVLKGITLKTGDTILVKYSNSTVKRSICVLQGSLVRLVKRGKGGDYIHTPKKSKKLDDDEDYEEKEELKEEIEEEIVHKEKKKKRKSEIKMEVDDDFEIVEEKKKKKKKKEKHFDEDCD
ncbi:hypothetical protein PMAYCL1PPCAC_12132, partial [Pristionchus mayeri]